MTKPAASPRQQQRRLRRPDRGAGRARIRGRPSGVKAAAHRFATALRAGPDPGDLCGPSGRKHGQARPAPAQRAPRPAISTPAAPEHRPTKPGRTEGDQVIPYPLDQRFP